VYTDLTDKDSDAKLVTDSLGVIYPAPNNLNLDAKFSQATYRPNEEARVNFSVLAGDKTPLESALGIIVFDKAIEERARADAEFGGDFNLFKNFSGLLGDADNFGSLSRRDLDEIDLSKPVSDDLQLAAEVMLHNSHYYPQISQSRNHTQAQNVYANYFKTQLAPVEAALKNAYFKNYSHPIELFSLRKILSENNFNFDDLRDPWGNNYRPVFEIEQTKNILRFESAGADKRFDTKDDFSVLGLSFEYLLPVGRAIDKAAADYHERTRMFIRDYATLRDELKKQGVDLDRLRDRWNREYLFEFEVAQRKYVIRVESRGADGADDWDIPREDDFDVWANGTDYFAETENQIQTILSGYAEKKKTFPKDAESFAQVLKAGGVDPQQIKDGYNQTVYVKTDIYSRYSDKVRIENTGKVGEKSLQKTTVEPVTQEVVALKLRSRGADAAEGTADDFDLAIFTGVVSEQGKSDPKPKTQTRVAATSGTKGAVRGTIKDVNGAVVAGATVTATNAETEEEFSATSNEDGQFLIENLPAGNYKISAEAAGFRTTTYTDFPVRAQAVTEADFELGAGGATQEVTVTGGVESIDTTSSQMSSGSEGFGNNGRGGTGKSEKNVSENKLLDEKSTPRLREYFPETLVWQPELITDKNGKAELKFKLGDNITTWKLYAIASDANGKIGIAQQEIRAFQPFFVDLEPPKFLTVGDEIALPVQIRNYTDAKQKVAVEMTKGDWFDFLNQPTQQIEVAPNNTQNAVFGFRANQIIAGGKQRVTAIADKDSDAIEKPVTVRPNGKEIVQTKSEIFRESVSFDVNFPANALPQTQKAELKIYPNLLAHVAESIEGLLQRPYGCGEQTISSTYPNLMVLKFAPKEGKLRAQATNYLQKGYERLLGYQQANGGFSVWAQDAPDVALTAYALRFLTDADEFIETDEDVIKRARAWLIKQQRADGSWTRQYNWEKTEDRQRTKLMTSYAARTLAMIEKVSKDKEAQTALQRGLEFLKTRNEEIDEPYALALFGLASLDAGNYDDAKAIAQKLESMAMQENAGAYWNLETNTPFYGWGTAGRIETTALVVQLLLKVQSSKLQVSSQEESQPSNLKLQSDGQTANLISKGTQFLLKNKDRYGVWYSTQTTINVLDAFLAAIGDGENGTNEN
ncbi:MAG: carboxypeptidase regulatory-like domain-containing protein, partial [Acidobacteriota bacterium]|nr:carboxypeptidase regulatory-like domain-containing protein [Acidobacteriota bacterium]